MKEKTSRLVKKLWFGRLQIEDTGEIISAGNLFFKIHEAKGLSGQNAEEVKEKAQEYADGMGALYHTLKFKKTKLINIPTALEGIDASGHPTFESSIVSGEIQLYHKKPSKE